MYRTPDRLFNARILNIITFKAEADVIYARVATQFNKSEYAIILPRKICAQVCWQSIPYGARNLPVRNQTIVRHGHFTYYQGAKEQPQRKFIY